MKLDIHGVEYSVERSGRGFPLLFLHGFTGSSATWEPFTSIFAESSTMLLLDVIGHGQTDSPKELDRYNILNVAADLKLLLDKLGIEKTDLLGYSMGGRLALTFAVNYPERVRKLVLESTSPGLKSKEEREARRKKDTQLANQILTQGIEAFVDYWENIPLFETQLNLSPETRGRIRSERLQNNPIGLANSLLGMGTGAQPSWWNSLKNVSIETLILAGEYDEKFWRIGEEMTKHIQKAEFCLISGAGHAIHVEEPEKFGTIVNGFLSK